MELKKCAASTRPNGTCIASSSVACSLAGVTPETSSIIATTAVNAASRRGAILAMARATGAAEPRPTSCLASTSIASSSGSR